MPGINPPVYYAVYGEVALWGFSVYYFTPAPEHAQVMIFDSGEMYGEEAYAESLALQLIDDMGLSAQLDGLNPPVYYRIQGGFQYEVYFKRPNNSKVVLHAIQPWAGQTAETESAAVTAALSWATSHGLTVQAES